MNQNEMNKQIEEAKQRLLESATEYGWVLASPNQSEMNKQIKEAKRHLLKCSTEYGWALASLLKAIDDLEALTVEIALQDKQDVS